MPISSIKYVNFATKYYNQVNEKNKIIYIHRPICRSRRTFRGLHQSRIYPNCAYRDDFLLFKLLIEKYSFLEHCYDFNLIDEIMNEYQSIAYQRDGKFDLYKYSSRLDNLGIKNFIIDECLIEE